MKTIGYINTSRNEEHLSHAEYMMNKLACQPILKEVKSEESDNPLWNYIMTELNPKDTLVIVSFTNVVLHSYGIITLLWLCKRKNINLISIMDCIDTSNCFFDTSQEDYINMLVSFYPEQKAEKIKVPPQSCKRTILTRHINLKHRNVINMYIVGYSVKAIMKQNDIDSKSTIYRILNKNKIKLDRINQLKKSDDKENSP